MDEKIERVRRMLNQGLSDIEICKNLNLHWDEFWEIFEIIYRES